MERKLTLLPQRQAYEGSQGRKLSKLRDTCNGLSQITSGGSGWLDAPGRPRKFGTMPVGIHWEATKHE
jgi:hypothetical protein